MAQWHLAPGSFSWPEAAAALAGDPAAAIMAARRAPRGAGPAAGSRTVSGTRETRPAMAARASQLS